MFNITLSVKHCCEPSELYILFIDKEHMVLGISVLKPHGNFCEAKFQFFSLNVIIVLKIFKVNFPHDLHIQSSKVKYSREN